MVSRENRLCIIQSCIHGYPDTLNTNMAILSQRQKDGIIRWLSWFRRISLVPQAWTKQWQAYGTARKHLYTLIWRKGLNIQMVDTIVKDILNAILQVEQASSQQ